MFCVWERSRAASTSSRMWRGAGLNSSRARMSDSATRHLGITTTTLNHCVCVCWLGLWLYTTIGPGAIIHCQSPQNAIISSYFCPPDNSCSDSFQMPPNATLTTSPSNTLMPSGGESLGSRAEKMEPKSW